MKLKVVRKVGNIFMLIFVLSIISCKDEVTSNVPSETKEITHPEDEKSNTIISTIKPLSADNISVENMDDVLLSELIISLVNKERNTYNLPAVINNRFLENAAKAHNKYIALSGKLTHTGNSSQTRDLRSRVNLTGGQFNLLAENIAMRSYFVKQAGGASILGNDTYGEVAKHFFDMWKNSQGHYKNMMLDGIRHIGVAVDWNDDQHAIYATQVFGD